MQNDVFMGLANPSCPSRRVNVNFIALRLKVNCSILVSLVELSAGNALDPFRRFSCERTN